MLTFLRKLELVGAVWSPNLRTVPLGGPLLNRKPRHKMAKRLSVCPQAARFGVRFLQDSPALKLVIAQEGLRQAPWLL